MVDYLHTETLVLGLILGGLLVTLAFGWVNRNKGPVDDMESTFPEDGVIGRDNWGETLNQLPDVNPVRSVVMPTQQPEPVKRIKRFPVQLPR